MFENLRVKSVAVGVRRDRDRVRQVQPQDARGGGGGGGGGSFVPIVFDLDGGGADNISAIVVDIKD